MIAYCGLVCDNCPIYLATHEQDKAIKKTMRKSISDLLADQYGMVLKPKDINDCDGCRAKTGRLFSSCQSCEIRQCAGEKSLENCAFCEQYACSILDPIFGSDPEARERLDNIRSTIHN
jgi:hypothetical protein